MVTESVTGNTGGPSMTTTSNPGGHDGKDHLSHGGTAHVGCAYQQDANANEVQNREQYEFRSAPSAPAAQALDEVTTSTVGFPAWSRTLQPLHLQHREPFRTSYARFEEAIVPTDARPHCCPANRRFGCCRRRSWMPSDRDSRRRPARDGCLRCRVHASCQPCSA
jgi:hypothetical protein